jgi:sialic acid synthase SpsE
MPLMQIGGRAVGDGQPVFIAAECGINHNGDLRMALQMIDEAARAGVDAVKFQLFTARGMYTPKAGLYRTAAGQMVPIYELMEQVELPVDWLPHLSRRCRQAGVKFIMTVCDEWCVEQMDQADFDCFKLASYELSHVPLLMALARRDMPIIISTGAANIADVVRAMEWLTPEGERPLGLLQCEAVYPARPEELHLRVIDTYRRMFPNAIAGFSDHSADPVRAPVQAVCHGARVIEKHFTLDRSLPGADHSFAVDPPDLVRMVKAVRQTEDDLAAGREPELDETLAGSPVRRMTEAEKALRDFAYRGIFTTRAIRPGDRLSRENIAVLRPGELAQGMHPRYYPLLSSGNYRATRAVEQWTGLDWDDVLVPAD